jgi:hypothetical protein
MDTLQTIETSFYEKATVNLFGSRPRVVDWLRTRIPTVPHPHRFPGWRQLPFIQRSSFFSHGFPLLQNLGPRNSSDPTTTTPNLCTNLPPSCNSKFAKCNFQSVLAFVVFAALLLNPSVHL